MIKINEQISQLRRQAGMTQEELASKLGVTNQAVSKWESAQCCPDIALLPDIARLFGLTIDELLTGSPAEKCARGDLPDVLKNDGVIRVLQFRGRELIRWDKREENGEKNTIKLEFPESGDKAHIEIYGNVESEGDVNCGNVGGDIQACGGVNCGNVGSDVQAGGDLNCGNVGDYVEADGDVACGNVDGNVNAGEDVTADTVYGDVSEGGDVNAGTVNGDVSAGGDVRYETLNGDRD